MGTHDQDEPPPWELEEVVVEDTKAAKRKKKEEDLDKLGMQVRNCACLTTQPHSILPHQRDPDCPHLVARILHQAQVPSAAFEQTAPIDVWCNIDLRVCRCLVLTASVARRLSPTRCSAIWICTRWRRRTCRTTSRTASTGTTHLAYTSLQNAKDLDSKSLQFLQTSTQLCINSTTFPGFHSGLPRIDFTPSMDSSHFRNQHSVTKTPALVGAGCLPTTTVG